MRLGESIGRWLEQLRPDGIYDATALHELRPFGVAYDEETGLLFCEGVLTSVRRYRPAETVRIPDYAVRFLDSIDSVDWLVTGADVAQALHQVLWPIEPAADPATGLSSSFHRNLRSIGERDHLCYRTTLTRRST